MNTMTKFTALGILLAGSLSGTQLAYANLNPPVEAKCVQDNFSMFDWLQAGGCIVGDKTWTLIDYDFDDDLADMIEIFFTEFGTGPTQAITLLPIEAIRPFPLAGVFGFDYSIVINDPKKAFDVAFVDADIPEQDGITNVVKDIYDFETGTQGALLASLQTFGDQDDFTFASPKPRALYIEETVTTQPGVIFFVTNTFRQTDIPEPISTTLIGAGLIGLAAIRRRRSTKA
jgi:hypothetical protein